MKLLISILLEMFWQLWSWTVRMDIHGLEPVDAELSQGLVPVFALPHHAILLGALAYRNRPATLLASLSSDGEFAAQFLAKRGFRLVRGSSSRGGKQALEQLKQALRAGEPVAITYDGPRGPELIPKPGIGVCAWHASGGLYLLKIRIRSSRLRKEGLCLRLKSWDRFVVPMPFCRVKVEFEKLEVLKKETHPQSEWVSHALSVLQAESLAFYRAPELVSVSETSAS